MRKILKATNSVVAAFALFNAVSCVFDIAGPERLVTPGAEDSERVEVGIDLFRTSINIVDSKSSLLDGAGNVQSGAVIYAFIIRDGKAEIDNYMTVSGDEVAAPGHPATASSKKMKLVSGAVYDFYVVGNAWYIDKSTGLTKDWASVMGQDMPVGFAGGLSDAEYRFDGSDFRSGCRHETLAEVKSYGIPYSGFKRGVQITNDGQNVVIDNCRYLFAKVTFTVDHTGLDGNLNDNFFKNQKVYLKQANPVILPFAEKNVLTGGSISADCDEAMTNGHCEAYTLYVPENCKGDLLSTTDPALKSGDNPALRSVKNSLTYIEFQGTVNPFNAYAAQIGYSGNVTYRFYLGADNCRNFDVIGGKDYKVTMGFTVDNLFNPSPLWRVETDSFNDGRYIDVMKDAAFANPLGATFVGVRKNRGNTVYLYVNKEGSTGGANAILGKSLVTDPSAYSAADLTDCAVHLSPSAVTLLADYGISVSYDKTTGALDFSVGNAAKFDALRAGAGQVNVTATLLPSLEGTKTRTFTVKALEDMEVVLPSGDLYIGQKTTVTAKGFCGTPKLSSSVGTVFRTTNVAGDGNYLSSTPVSFTNGKIDLYAYNWNGGSEFNLTLVSDDDFNDGSTTKPISVKKPRLKLGLGEVDLGIDGTEKDLGVEYYPESGATPFVADAFDAAVYEQVMAPVFTLREEAKRQYFGFSGSQVFFKSIPELVNSRTLFGNVDVSGKNSTIFPMPDLGYTSTKVYYRYPSWVSGFSDIHSNMFNEQMPAPASGPLISTSAVIDAAECSPENFKGTSGALACGYTVVSGNDFATEINTEYVGKSLLPNLLFGEADSRGYRTLTWSWDPSIQMCLDNGINAPWGERSVFPVISNKHNAGGTVSVALASAAQKFDISYTQLAYVRLAVYHLNTNESFCYVCSRLSADVATKVFESKGKTVFPTPPSFMRMYPVMEGRQYTVNDWKSVEGGMRVNCSGSNKLTVDIRVLRCILGGDPFLTPESREYEDCVWDVDLIEDQRRKEFALPMSIGFGQTTQLGGATSLAWQDYPGEGNYEKQRFFGSLAKAWV